MKNKNNWISFQDNSKLFGEIIKKEGDCIVKYDTGEILKYFDDQQPPSILTHFIPISVYLRRKKLINIINKT